MAAPMNPWRAPLIIVGLDAAAGTAEPDWPPGVSVHTDPEGVRDHGWD